MRIHRTNLFLLGGAILGLLSIVGPSIVAVLIAIWL